MARRKKTSSRGLGDDPLTWIKEVAHPAGASSPHDRAASEALVSGHAASIAQEQSPSATITTTAIDSTEPIVLNAVITIAEAATLKEILLPHISRNGEVCIDGSRVESVDTAALQVLLAFVRTLQGHGANISWTSVSATLLNTAQLLGVAEQIGLRT